MLIATRLREHIVEWVSYIAMWLKDHKKVSKHNGRMRWISLLGVRVQLSASASFQMNQRMAPAGSLFT